MLPTLSSWTLRKLLFFLLLRPRRLDFPSIFEILRKFYNTLGKITQCGFLPNSSMAHSLLKTEICTSTSLPTFLVNAWAPKIVRVFQLHRLELHFSPSKSTIFLSAYKFLDHDFGFHIRSLQVVGWIGIWNPYIDNLRPLTRRGNGIFTVIILMCNIDAGWKVVFGIDVSSWEAVSTSARASKIALSSSILSLSSTLNWSSTGPISCWVLCPKTPRL